MARMGPWFPVTSPTSESRSSKGHSWEEGIDLQVHWRFMSRNHRVTGLSELGVWIQTGLGWIPGLATYCNCYCCSVTKACPTLCDPVDCSTPGSPVLHYFPEFAQTHVHWVGNAIQTSHSLLSTSPPALNLSQHQGLFQWVGFLHQVAKVLELQLQHQSFLWIFRVDFL